jgi:predicted transcriptional regulator
MADHTHSAREIFPERLYLQAPRGLNRALDELAWKQRTTRAEVVRRALMREVESNGVPLDEPERAA